MAIGDTVQAGLGRMDFSAFQRAGEAQARVGEQLGRTVGGVIEQYQLNKERQKEDKATIKSTIGILERIKKLDPENEPQYLMQIEQLNNEDMGLGICAKTC